MDLKQINRAVEGYLPQADEADAARLRFFKGLFELQQRRADELEAVAAYEPAPGDQLDRAYLAGTAAFTAAPVVVAARDLAATCAQVAAELAAHAGLADQAAFALREADWDELLSGADLGLAGSDPVAFVTDVVARRGELGVPTALTDDLLAMALAFSLRPHLQGPAARVMGAVSDDAKSGSHSRPLDCPVCGSPAALSRVGEVDTLHGGARIQYCATCGTSWPFERIRCGSCGSRSQEGIHHFHVDGDEAHRLETCEECGQYQRVVFANDLQVPLALEVEDVVMAKLDRIALDPRFSARGE
ncbi:formate dehydrogenase accessory protein FdhE [Eggerthellaceae bacterium zg-997]|nr:formate dehydrogenase accessory protein FdhE [Eggerthellaceae bacterium zg-997]